jgi:hypothetical protein
MGTTESKAPAAGGADGRQGDASKSALAASSDAAATASTEPAQQPAAVARKKKTAHSQNRRRDPYGYGWYDNARSGSTTGRRAAMRRASAITRAADTARVSDPSGEAAKRPRTAADGRAQQAFHTCGNVRLLARRRRGCSLCPAQSQCRGNGQGRQYA